MANAPKKAAQTAKKTAETTVKANISAIESHVHTTDQFVHAGTDAVRDFLAAGTEEAQRTQAQVLSYSREHAEKLAEAADKSSRAFTELLAISKDNLDAYVQSGKIASDLGKDLQEEFVASLNENFTSSVELTKELLACRTVNDVVEIQKRAVQNSVNQLVTHTSRWTDLWLKLATEAAEPINQQVTEASERLNKTLAA